MYVRLLLVASLSTLVSLVAGFLALSLGLIALFLASCLVTLAFSLITGLVARFFTGFVARSCTGFLARIRHLTGFFASLVALLLRSTLRGGLITSGILCFLVAA